ncbi:uncharacterized protein [Halyomorpha halys]|uniref:uncharacterized protein isoform X2 n=1 Tax=Halyomorpha halys TaxID=286706 RepID=UPI0006D50485|nr:uncharacterized protein LOC106687459 isoform X2 [Halyomorpha halys]
MRVNVCEEVLQEVLTTKLGPLNELSVFGVDHDVTDNYTSDMTRLGVRVVTGAGECHELSLLVKKSGVGDNSLNGDITEIKMYKEVLPKMEKLIAKMISIHEEPLWAHCIGHFNNTLVLEDLQVLGYQTVDRTNGLDYQHAALVMRGLAQFHAISVVLHDIGELKSADFKNFVFDGRYEHLHDFITSGFQYLLRIATQEWSPEWKDIIENVSHIPEIAVKKLQEITQLQEGGFHVLNHGDTWVNNVMFKHNEGTPETIKFVDFQLSHFNSYAFDLHYMVNTSVSSEVLHHIDRLYEEYHYHLTSELAKLGRSDGPSLSEVFSELRRTEFFGLFTAIAVSPVILARQELASPKDKSGYTLAELEQRKEDRYRTEEYTRRIQVILRCAQHGGLFERLHT